MGGVAKAIGSIPGKIIGGIVGGAGDSLSGGGATAYGNSTGLDMNYGQQIKDRSGDTAGNTAFLDKLLMDQASGASPSVAQQQLQMTTDQNVQNAMAMAASSRGVNTGLAAREAMRAGTDANQQATGQASLLRAQEQQQAAQNMMANQAQKDSFITGMNSIGTSRDTGQASTSEAGKNRSMQGAGNLMGAAGGAAGAMAMSDENAKKNVKDASLNIDAFLDHIKSVSYEYKDKDKNKEGAGKGKYVGVMAQDLEKSGLGEMMVKDTKDGKKVDFGKGFGLLLASQARINERLKELEDK